MSQQKASRGAWPAVLVGVVAVVCCVAGPAVAGVLGGAVLWGLGVPVALVIAVVLAGGCYALLTSSRRRRRSAP